MLHASSHFLTSFDRACPGGYGRGERRYVIDFRVGQDFGDGQRVLPELQRTLPELDQIAGNDRFVEIARQRARALAGTDPALPVSGIGRQRSLCLRQFDALQNSGYFF
jgi:hypothetical protein